MTERFVILEVILCANYWQVYDVFVGYILHVFGIYAADLFGNDIVVGLITVFNMYEGKCYIWRFSACTL